MGKGRLLDPLSSRHGAVLIGVHRGEVVLATALEPSPDVVGFLKHLRRQGHSGTGRVGEGSGTTMLRCGARSWRRYAAYAPPGPPPTIAMSMGRSRVLAVRRFKRGSAGGWWRGGFLGPERPTRSRSRSKAASSRKTVALDEKSAAAPPLDKQRPNRRSC
jgi:hypothetical protein